MTQLSNKQIKRRRWKIKYHIQLRNKIVQNCRFAGCDECGSLCDLTYHHLNPNDKLFNISSAVYKPRFTIKSLIEEIMKCSVLCMDCHKKYH